MKLSATHIPELDGVRGLAVLLVLIQHYAGSIIPRGSSWSWVSDWLILCRTGVDLFFVLSGFLIGGILLDQRDTRNLFKVFYIRRIMRILPLYFLLFACFVIARQLGQTGYLYDGPIPLLAYATFTQNYFMASMLTAGAIFMAVTWTLAIEEQFYLVFPLFVKWVSPAILPLLLLLGIAFASLMRIWAYFYYDNNYYQASFWLICRIDSLFVGVMLAWAVRHDGIRNWLNEQKPLVTWVLGVLGMGMLTLVYAANRDIAYHMSMWGFTLLALFYGMLVLWVILYAGENRTRFFRINWLVYLGLISYAVYLIHQPVLYVLFGCFSLPVALMSWRDAGLVIIALTLTILVCAISFKWYERPLLAIGRRLTYQ